MIRDTWKYYDGDPYVKIEGKEGALVEFAIYLSRGGRKIDIQDGEMEISVYDFGN